MTIKEMRERQAQIVAEARERTDQITASTDEARTTELETQHDAAMAEYDALEKKIEREQQVDDLATRHAEREERQRDSRRPRGEDRTTTGGGRDDEITHRSAFNQFMRIGYDDLSAEERAVLREHRAQSVGTASAGGYLVPVEFIPDLIKSMKAWGPMLDPGITSELVTSSGQQITMPTLNDTANTGYRLAENTETTSEGDLAFGQKTLDAYKYASGPILVSNELLQDSELPFESLVRDAMAERIARKVNLDLTTGDGTGDPNGVVTASSAGKTAAAAAATTFDEIIDLIHSVDPAYRGAGCRFMFNDTTLAVLRKLKDGDGNYLWQPAHAQSGEPSTVFGYAYSINQAMDSLAATKVPIIFGDFSKYVVRRVREFAVRRLDERYAEYDQVGFIGFGRYDGELLDTAAVKKMTMAAS